MMMKMLHSAFPQPPMSWLRKMSPNTRNSNMIHTTKRKNQSNVQNIPSSG